MQRGQDICGRPVMVGRQADTTSRSFIGAGSCLYGGINYGFGYFGHGMTAGVGNAINFITTRR